MPINNTITPTGRGIPSTTTVTIANGQSLSGAVNLSGFTLIGIDLPSAWTTANLTLQASIDNSTWVDVDTFTANSEEVGFEPELMWYRVGVKTGEFTSGTVVLRLGREDADRH